METNAIIAFGLGLVLLYVVGSVFATPARIIGKLILNGILGGIILWIINILGGGFGIQIAINPLTALIVGFLGIPGILLLLILQVIF
ncbi:MAG: pro-sigmaK processing inhibitor BofA family protein [Clostridia bacterium]|nr:pro-sigmaK processing inhibitor BofA family protein [Clostridia bacterium]